MLALAATVATPAAVAATSTTYVDPNAPVLVSSQTVPPAGYRLNARTVEAIAAKVPKVVDVVRGTPGAYPGEYKKGPGQWQVSWFTRKGKEIAQVYVSDATGQVTQAWTGFQVAWSMARGYSGAFGRRVNAWYVWLPMCLAFILPFVPWRARRPSLLHLDLLVLLLFSVSLAFFNNADLGLSVPLVYPCLLYLLARMLAIGFGWRRANRDREPLKLLIPVSWLAIATIFLVGFRIGLNVTNSNVIDVGYAGVIGASKITHGTPLYGNWPHDNPQGDTYGPVDYFAYVPFYALIGWSGSWDDLPAAHAAAIVFDLLTLLGLYWLGRRVRGPTLGVLLAYAWAAYPFTLYALSSNSNDSLVALLVVASLLLITSAPARGIVGALAGLTKFAPLALGPLLLRGTGRSLSRKSVLLFVLGYGAAALAAMAYVLLDGNLSTMWKDTVSYQISRPAPFSVWGLWGHLAVVQRLVQGAAIGLALAVGVIPRVRSTVQVAALGAAVLIALQLAITYWFYLYIPWFTPLVLLAVLGVYAERGAVAAAGMAVAEPVAITA